ncbi:MAG TPA: hypothetical protein VGM39_24485 [Kofleriaceae bacterium]|jgi:hypothetical protein
MKIAALLLLAACGGSPQRPNDVLVEPSEQPEPTEPDPAPVPGFTLDADAIDLHAHDPVERQAPEPQGEVTPDPAAGALTGETLSAAIRNRYRAFLACDGLRQTDAPIAQGVPVLSFTIDEHGVVTSTTISGFSPAVDTCLANEIRRTKFPPGPAKVSYPFR